MTAIGPYNSIDYVPPADKNRYIGASFQHQTPNGVFLTDAGDDRVDYVAGEDGYPIEQVSYRLGQDLPSDGVAAASFGPGDTGSNPRVYGENPSNVPDPTFNDTISGTAFTSATGNGIGWYSTLRPYAGLPVPGCNDQEEADKTGETEPVVRGEYYYGGALSPIGERILPDRRAMDIPDKAARNPASPNDERPWDITMGAWPWTGQKAAMQQPVASMPRFYPEPLADGIPSPTGAAFAMVPNTVDLAPHPLTWRLTPTPYDTGQAGYVDAGTGG